MPLVSVIMSVYNGERYLLEAIESILAQTFTDFEFLIMNDGSTDNTACILQAYGSRYPRITVLSQDNKGLNVSLNRLIAESKGKYLARMDADDISEPDRLSSQVKYMEEHPDCAFVVGGSLVINENGDVINGKYLKDNDARLRKTLYSGTKNPFTHGAIMFRKANLLELGLIYRFRYSQDFDLLIRLAARHKIGSVEKILYRYREGSLLQRSHKKLLQRLKQRRTLLWIYRQGRIFDDRYCLQETAKISTDETDQIDQSEESFKIAGHRIKLKALYLTKNRQALRSNSIELIKNYGWRKGFLSYLLISFLPLKLSFAGYDILIRMRNRLGDKVVCYLSTRELTRFQARQIEA